MSVTIFYKGTLDAAASPQDVFAIAVGIADEMEWTSSVEGDTLAIDIPDSFSETLVFNFVDRRLDGWCKYDLEEPEEFETALELFYAIKPLFSEYKVFDDYGQWFEFLVEKEPQEIELRELNPDEKAKVKQACAEDLEYSLVMERPMDGDLLARYLDGELFLRLIVDDKQEGVNRTQGYRQFYDSFDPKAYGTATSIASDHKSLALVESWLFEKMGLKSEGKPSGNPPQCWDGLPEATREGIQSFLYAMGNTLFTLYCPTISVEDARIRRLYTDKVEPEAAHGTGKQDIYQQAMLMYRFVLSSLEYLGLTPGQNVKANTGKGPVTSGKQALISSKSAVAPSHTATSKKQSKVSDKVQDNHEGLTKKQVKKMIDKIVAPAFAEEEFFEGPPDEPGIWLFIRKVGDVEHYISFRAFFLNTPKGRACQLEQFFYTNVPRSSNCRPTQLVEYIPSEAREKFYDSEEQFEEYLLAMTKFSIEVAIPFFGYLARSRCHTTREMYAELSVDTQEKAEAFMQDHGLFWADDAAGIMEMVLKTEEIIKKVQFEPFNEVKGLLFAATAYLGELIRKVFGGEWMWEPKCGLTYLLCKVGGNDMSPLITGSLYITQRYWKVPEVFSFTLRYDYGRLLESLNNKYKHQE